MSRPNIMSLKLTAQRRYRPSRAAPGKKGVPFETQEFCEKEDEIRAKSAAKAAQLKTKVFTKKAASTVAKKLGYKRLGKKPPKSMLSSRYMRRIRNRLISNIWKMVARYHGKVTTFTVVKRGWEFMPEELLAVELDKLLQGFLSDLNRRGAGKADGWLIAFIHGEHETPANIIRLHLHGIVAGGMIRVVDSLRTGRNYKKRVPDTVGCRVRIDRKRLSHLPHPFTYCFKAYWPWKHVIIGAKGKRRTRRHKRIQEPYLTLVLLFLDQHAPSDFVVLKHVSVKAGQLQISRNNQRRRK